MVTSAFLKFGSIGIPTFAAASAHCFFRWSVGATTMSWRTVPRLKSSLARVSAKVVLPAPGVATAMKSRGFFSKYFCMASACQARRCTEVPQGARSGYAGESFGFTMLSNSVGSSGAALILSFFLVCLCRPVLSLL